MDLRFLICIVLIAVCHADTDAEIEAKAEKLTFGCLEKYLKSKLLLDSNFKIEVPNIDATEYETVCNNFMKDFTDKFYKKLEVRLATKEEIGEDSKCVVDRLKKHDFADLTMKFMVYERVNENEPDRKHKKALKAVDYTMEKRSENAIILFKASKEFGTIFDRLLDITADGADNDAGDGLIEDYCVKKYLIDNNFIDPTTYTINLNPKNIDVTGVECKEIVDASKTGANNDFKEIFEDETKKTSRRTQKCLNNAAISNNYFENISKVAVFGEAKISRERLEPEKSQFIDSFKKMYEIAAEC